MKTKKFLSLMLTIVIAVSMTATLSVTASAAKIATLHSDVKCTDTLQNMYAHFYITSITYDTIYGIWYGIDGSKDESYSYSKSLAEMFSVQGLTFEVGKWYAWNAVLFTSCDGHAPANECNLDLESSTATVKDSKELDQNYNLTVTNLTSAYGAITKVKLSWEINDINAVRMDKKVWDTTELKWVVAASNTTVFDNGTAKFTLENYSSVKVRATASFKAESGFNPTVTYTGKNGRITLDTANGNNTYSKTNVPTGTINVTVKPGTDDFKSLATTASATKYGAYTVTLSENRSDYQSYANNIANEAVPTTFVVDEADKTITIKDEKAFLYYGLVYNDANAYQMTAKLDVDLDLDELVIANGFNCRSSFNGNNHTIKNLTVTGTANGTAGFFKAIGASGNEAFVTVENLVLDSIHINGGICTNNGSFGILAGSAVCTAIKNVTAKNSSVTGGKFTGGIVGYAYTDVIGCTVKDSTVSGQYKCGGIVGYICAENSATADVKNNAVESVQIKCADLLSDKNHYETGKVVGNYNANGTYTGNSVTNVTIVNGSDGYTNNEIGAVEEGRTVVYTLEPV